MIIVHPAACKPLIVRKLQERTGMVAVLSQTACGQFRARLVPFPTRKERTP